VKPLRQLGRKHGQTIVNIVVFAAIGRWLALYAIQKYRKDILWDFVEIAFLAHMALLLLFVLIRRPHVAIDRNLFHQAVALAAFFSGIGYQDRVTDNRPLLIASQIVTAVAIGLGILTQVNLGRSFGILIAVRKIRTDWLYSVVRHPMYLTDMMFKLGMTIRKPTLLNLGITLFGAACYVYRALLEEKFLWQFPEYREYKKKVRYRFLPGLF